LQASSDMEEQNLAESFVKKSLSKEEASEGWPK
jgi:hypothetical protein